MPTIRKIIYPREIGRSINPTNYHKAAHDHAISPEDAGVMDYTRTNEGETTGRQLSTHPQRPKLGFSN